MAVCVDLLISFDDPHTRGGRRHPEEDAVLFPHRNQHLNERAAVFFFVQSVLFQKQVVVRLRDRRDIEESQEQVALVTRIHKINAQNVFYPSSDY